MEQLDKLKKSKFIRFERDEDGQYEYDDRCRKKPMSRSMIGLPESLYKQRIFLNKVDKKVRLKEMNNFK